MGEQQGQVEAAVEPGEPVGAEPVEAEPVGAEPVEAEPVGTEPVEAEPVGTEPVEAEPVGTETTGPEDPTPPDVAVEVVLGTEGQEQAEPQQEPQPQPQPAEQEQAGSAHTPSRPVPGPPVPAPPAAPAVVLPPLPSSPDADPTEFGRIASDGTAYVRTPDGGERAIGTWSPRDVEEGLQHFARRFFDLEVRVANLEERLAAGAAPPGQVRQRAGELRQLLSTAAVIGDLGALGTRLDAVVAAAETQRGRSAEQRAREAAEALAKREALVAEAEELSTSERWKATGERFGAIVEEWKGVRGGDRGAAQELWQRLSSARRTFSQRRSAHFAELDRRNAEVRARKEELVTQAEAKADSTDWAATTRYMQDLQAAWKETERLPRGPEERLWKRFRGAQDRFFTARNADRASRDEEQASTVAVKEALLAEAEALDVEGAPGQARARLRDIGERWEAAGRVPRADAARLEARLRAVEEKVRDRSGARARPPRPVTAGDVMVEQLRGAVAESERKAASARERGDVATAERVEASLLSQRQLLTEAERSLARRR